MWLWSMWVWSDIHVGVQVLHMGVVILHVAVVHVAEVRPQYGCGQTSMWVWSDLHMAVLWLHHTGRQPGSVTLNHAI